MHTSELSAPCATGNAARSSQPGEAVSSQVTSDRRRLHNAISQCHKRIEAAKRQSDFWAELGSKDDMERLLNQLARLPIIGETKTVEG